MYSKSLLSASIAFLQAISCAALPAGGAPSELDKRGFGKMTYPLKLSALPEGMTFTITAINKNQPEGMLAYTSGNLESRLPMAFTSSDVGATPKHIGEFILQVDGAGFNSGQGASFSIEYTVTGKTPTDTSAEEVNVRGELTIATSEWGTFSRPDQSILTWKFGDHGDFGSHSMSTPTLVYLDDVHIAVLYSAEAGYGVGVSSDKSTLKWVTENMVGGIITGHTVIWGAAAGAVGTVTGTGMKIVFALARGMRM